VLIDYAETCPGSWVEDAIYLEHLFWAMRDRLEGRKLASMLAKARRQQGLAVAEDWPRLASIRRALLAMRAPCEMRRVGAGAAHLDAALQVLERETEH